MHTCEIRSERDVDWAINRVLLGDRVLVQAGGLHRPRRHQLRQELALGCLKARIEGLGGQMLLDQDTNAIRRLTQGRTALLIPPESGGGDFGGVREPRRPTPNPSTSCVELTQPELS